MLEVVGNRVLIKPKELEKKTDSGIIINYGSAEKLHEAATMLGTVVGIGPCCWEDYGHKEWVKIGDDVVFAQYAGKIVSDPDTKEKYFVVNDIDVQVKVNTNG
jgi:co-chaperonin GroES (HSP10)